MVFANFFAESETINLLSLEDEVDFSRRFIKHIGTNLTLFPTQHVYERKRRFNNVLFSQTTVCSSKHIMAKY